MRQLRYRINGLPHLQVSDKLSYFQFSFLDNKNEGTYGISKKTRGHFALREVDKYGSNWSLGAIW